MYMLLSLCNLELLIQAASVKGNKKTAALGEKACNWAHDRNVYVSFCLFPFASHGVFSLIGKECDLNRQCGVVNPETKKICTRLLTCKVCSCAFFFLKKMGKA